MPIKSDMHGASRRYRSRHLLRGNDLSGCGRIAPAAQVSRGATGGTDGGRGRGMSTKVGTPDGRRKSARA